MHSAADWGSGPRFAYIQAHFSTFGHIWTAFLSRMSERMGDPATTPPHMPDCANHVTHQTLSLFNTTAPQLFYDCAGHSRQL